MSAVSIAAAAARACDPPPEVEPALPDGTDWALVWFGSPPPPPPQAATIATNSAHNAFRGELLRPLFRRSTSPSLLAAVWAARSCADHRSVMKKTTACAGDQRRG